MSYWPFRIPRRPRLASATLDSMSDLTPAIPDEPTQSLATTPVQPMAPAGWHPHPSNSGLLRYWDGSAWTEHTAPAVQAPGPAQPQQLVIHQSNVMRAGGYGPTTNHLGHFFLTVLTAGLWLPVWVIIAAVNSSKRRQMNSY